MHPVQGRPDQHGREISENIHDEDGGGLAEEEAALRLGVVPSPPQLGGELLDLAEVPQLSLLPQRLLDDLLLHGRLEIPTPLPDHVPESKPSLVDWLRAGITRRGQQGRIATKRVLADAPVTLAPARAHALDGVAGQNALANVAPLGLEAAVLLNVVLLQWLDRPRQEPQWRQPAARKRRRCPCHEVRLRLALLHRLLMRRLGHDDCTHGPSCKFGCDGVRANARSTATS
mmetsp:Transcript_101211/g.292676  ORF Transcript_101211/g.292676 Transcript_101211/m.292676 type:complete len:230 (-) Transcript_101211:8-697(-)